MKKKALAVLLTASVIAGTMGGTATIVHADEEGKVINIYSWNDEFRQRLEAVYPVSRVHFQRWYSYKTERWYRDPLDRKSEPGWRISAETG